MSATTLFGGGGVGTLGRESLLFPFWNKYFRQYFRLVVKDKLFLVVFSSIVRIRIWFLTHISTTLGVFITRVLLCKHVNLAPFRLLSRLITDHSFGGPLLLAIIRSREAWVLRYGNSQALLRSWNCWMPRKWVSQQFCSRRPGYCRFVWGLIIYVSYLSLQKVHFCQSCIFARKCEVDWLAS